MQHSTVPTTGMKTTGIFFLDHNDSCVGKRSLEAASDIEADHAASDDQKVGSYHESIGTIILESVADNLPSEHLVDARI